MNLNVEMLIRELEKAIALDEKYDKSLIDAISDSTIEITNADGSPTDKSRDIEIIKSTGKYKRVGMKQTIKTIKKLSIAKEDAEKILNQSEKKRFYGWVKFVMKVRKFFGIK